MAYFDWGKLKVSSTEYRPVLVDGEDLQMPDQHNCLDAKIPPEVGVAEKGVEPGKRKVTIPDLPSMTKIAFERYKSDMFQAVRDLAACGALRNVVGYDSTTRFFNSANCNFELPDYYKISRESFFAEFPVKLYLKTIRGETAFWHGFLHLKFDFAGRNRSFTVSGISNETMQGCGLTKLDKYLNPVLSNKEVDEEGERIWQEYYKDAFYDRRLRSGSALAERMGLDILYLPVHDRSGTPSMLFFKEAVIPVKKKDPYDKSSPAQQIIQPGTIVVNTNVLRKDYSDFNIYHECYHDENHYLFFASQDIACSDLSSLPTKTLIVGELEEVRDPLFFVEKQADRGAFALMMPRSETSEMIDSIGSQTANYKHAGEKYETIGMSIVRELSLPQFRVRSRMVQLGHLEAKGCLNWADNHKLEPFAFSKEAYEDPRITFIIDRNTLTNLCYNNPELRKIMDSKRYVHVDGHVVKNDPQFVQNSRNGLCLTEEAKANLDICCLRFIRIFIRNSGGKYVFGRLNYDEDYLKWTMYFLEDTMKTEGVDEFDAKQRFIQNFPKDFKEGVEELMRKRKISQGKMAEIMNMDRTTFLRSLANPKIYRNEDFLMVLALALKLPDWLSALLFKRAKFQLDEDDKRQQALAHVLRVQFADGIKAANSFLKNRNLEPLRI